MMKGLDPIGTPRRNGSLNGSLNSNGHAGLPRVSSHSTFPGNIVTPSNGEGNADDFWLRYNQLKHIDATKDNLLEEVLTRYTYLQQTHNDYVRSVEQDRMRSSGQPSEREEMYKNACQKFADMLNREPFVMVLIDGDGMVFNESLIRHGAKGGKQAADMLYSSVTDWVHDTLKACPSAAKIVVQVFVNVRGLADSCRRAKVVTSADTVEEFVRGFTAHNDLFKIVDVGAYKDKVEAKMMAEFELHVPNYQCRHILYGCSRSTSTARMLESYSMDEDVSSRVTLLEGIPFGEDFEALPYEKLRFDNIFRDSQLKFGPADVMTDNPRIRQDSKSAFNPTSGVFTPASRTPAPETPLFSPLTGPGVSSPAISNRNDLTRTNSVASSCAVSEAPQSGGGGAGGAWANIARCSKNLPFKDLTRPPPEPKAKITGPVVRQNKDGQRVDAPMDYDHERVYELKKAKYCNQHYIGRGCCHWEAGNGACPHKHDTKLNKDDLKWLRVVARETVCKKGTSCLDFECIYGHHCPYPKMTEGSMRGVGCINGEHCRFAREMHGMDTTVATILRPEDV